MSRLRYHFARQGGNKKRHADRGGGLPRRTGRHSLVIVRFPSTPFDGLRVQLRERTVSVRKDMMLYLNSLVIQFSSAARRQLA